MNRNIDAEHTAEFDAAPEGVPEGQPAEILTAAEAPDFNTQTKALSSEDVVRKQHELETTVIDGLEIIDEVARGGMGAVLRAREKALNREVAVKVLLNKQRQRPETVRRFIEEAQIGGQLQHPGVVPVYGIGRFGEDCPYFTMKLVKGRTLSSLLKERKEHVAERAKFLKMFEQLCQTVAYAHSKNVIHRDLKPANVMVGNFGEVQVMDWGLAKVLDATARPKPATANAESRATTIRTLRSSPTGTVEFEPSGTQSGSVLGTPAYMAPEQAIGDVENLDARADVFGLGAILCEILTGRPPYIGSSVTKTLQKALRAELKDAFVALDACHADAELIALNKECLAAEPDERPADAGALAHRLTEYLDSVETRLRIEQLGRIEAQTKAVEEAKRRQAQLWYVSAAGIILLAGIAGTYWGLLQARTALRTVELAKIEEGRQRELAEQRRREADAERDRAVAAEKDTRAFSDFLVDNVLATPRPKGVQQGLGVDITMSEALTKAQQQIDDVFRGRPKAEATARYALGLTWRNLGRFADAERHLRAAAKLQSKEFGEDSPEAMRTLNQLAIALLDQSKYDEALSIFERVHGTRKHTLGDDNAETLTVLTNLALNYKRAGNPAKAIAIFEKVHDAQVKTLGPTHEATLKTLNNLAEALRATGKIADAIELLEQVCDGFKGSLGPTHAATLTAQNNLALAYRDAKKLPEAIVLMEKVCAGRTKAIKRDHPNTLNSLHSLAVMYLEADRKDAAIKLFEEVRDVRTKRFGIDNPLTQRTLRQLGTTYRQLGRTEEAIAVLRQLNAGLEQSTTATRVDGAIAKSMLGEALLDANKPAEAEPLLSAGMSALLANEKTLSAEYRAELAEAIDRMIRLAEVRKDADRVRQLRQKKAELKASKR